MTAAKRPTADRLQAVRVVLAETVEADEGYCGVTEALRDALAEVDALAAERDRAIGKLREAEELVPVVAEQAERIARLEAAVQRVIDVWSDTDHPDVIACEKTCMVEGRPGWTDAVFFAVGDHLWAALKEKP